MLAAMQVVTPVFAVIVAAAWLWFLALGRSRGAPKRLALRATLAALLAAMWAVASRRDLLTHASYGFRFALLAAVLVVAVGYLYLIRFCDVCGRMVRNLKPATCPRCGAALPRHGMTTRLRMVEPEQAKVNERRGRRGG
jgi:hypothetical protein